jgi:hypothetical protein
MFPHIGAATSACWRTWDICALICWDSTRAEKIHLEPEYPSRSRSLCPYSKVVQVDLKVKLNLLVIVEVEMSRGLQIMVDHVKSRYIANYHWHWHWQFTPFHDQCGTYAGLVEIDTVGLRFDVSGLRFTVAPEH